MTRHDEQLEAIRRFHEDVDRAAAQVASHHRGRLRCALGCTDCCLDDLTVFEVEAARIRSECAALLDSEPPHPPGRCAFLDASGACRIHTQRPYVCRTQGLPLRWIEDAIEYRDICPLNEEGPAIEELPTTHCWTIGPLEERLQALQRRCGGGELKRVALRDLFEQ